MSSARLLRLLTLLQTRREWSGADLAGRLGVSTRTLRRDVDKLRDLEYSVHATSGTAGGYQLGPGASLPPLLLDDDEAVAVAISLRTAASGGVAIGETALQALVKLEQVLPSRLRHRVNSVQVATVDTPNDEVVALEVLTAVASARPDWRSFRVDRMSPRVPLGRRFEPREIPGGDPAAFLATRFAQMWPFQAAVRLHLPADHEKVRRMVTWGTIEEIDKSSCRLIIGADTPQSLAFLLSFLEIEFEVESSPELARALQQVTERFQRAAAALFTPASGT